MEYKINEVPEGTITRNMFENKTSFERFMKGLNFLAALQHYKDAGHWVIKNGEIIKGDFILRTTGGIMPCMGEKVMSACISGWLGYTYGLKVDTIYVGAEEMKVFDGIQVLDPSYAKEFKIS